MLPHNQFILLDPRAAGIAMTVRLFLEERLRRRDEHPGPAGSSLCAWSKDLCGACALSSMLLSRMLRRRGFDAQFVFGYWRDQGDHSWVSVGTENGRRLVVDVTATQFGLLDKVFVHDELHCSGSWKSLGMGVLGYAEMKKLDPAWHTGDYRLSRRLEKQLERRLLSEDENKAASLRIAGPMVQ